MASSRILTRLARRRSPMGKIARRLLGRPEREDVAHLYRTLLGREPESETVVEAKQARHWREMVTEIAGSAEAVGVNARRRGVNLFDRVLGENVRRGDVVVELDVGADRRTLELAELVGPEGTVHAFEWEASTRSAFRRTVGAAGHRNVRLPIVDGADSLESLIQSIDRVDFVRIGPGVRWDKIAPLLTHVSRHPSVGLLVRLPAEDADVIGADLRSMHFGLEVLDEASGEVRPLSADGAAPPGAEVLCRRPRRDPQRSVTRAEAIWSYRLFLDREPESERAIEEKLRHEAVAGLRSEFLSSEEFRAGHMDPNRSERFVVIKELEGFRIFLDLSDNLAGSIARGRHEVDELAFVRWVLSPGDVAIDIGGHLGVFTLTMASSVAPHGHVSSFEPVEENADLLARSIIENGFQDVITLEHALVGDRVGSVPFAVPNDSFDLGSGCLAGGGAADYRDVEIRQLPMVSLDQHPIARPVRLIKIDAEGAEPLCVRGARGILERDRPVLLCELNVPQLQRVSGCTPDELIGEFRSIGYTCHELVDARAADPIDRAPDTLVATVVFLP